MPDKKIDQKEENQNQGTNSEFKLHHRGDILREANQSINPTRIPLEDGVRDRDKNEE